MSGTFYNQILSLLTSPPGNLAYHLILAFSIAGALPGAVSLWLKVMPVEGRRMALGLSGLLLIQTLPGIFSIKIQPDSTIDFWLPVIDRGGITLSIVLMAWLWLFPSASRYSDLSAILLSALIITLTTFAGLWMKNSPSGEAFNASLVDSWWNLLSFLLVLTGIVLLLLRRPPGYENGLAFFALLLVGHILHFFWPLPNVDYSGNVRLAQIAAFPILLTLPSRFSTSEVDLSKHRRRGSSQAGIQLDIFKQILALSSWKSTAEIYRAVSALVAHAMNADLCLLMTPPDSNRVISILSGYDRRKSQFLGTATFDGNLIPVLAEAIRQARPLHLPADSRIPDLTGLEKILDLPLAGALLAAPLVTDPQTPKPNAPAIVLLTPYSRHPWTAADQNYLAEIIPNLAEILQRAQETKDLQERLKLTQRSLQTLQKEHERLLQNLKIKSRGSPPAPLQGSRFSSTLINTPHEGAEQQPFSPLPMDQAVSHLEPSESSNSDENTHQSLVDLNELLGEALAEAEIQLQERDLRLDVDIQERLPLVKGDGGQLRNLIQQLLSTAITVSPDHTTIALRAHRKGSPGERPFIQIQVQDSGSKIDPRDLEPLFAMSSNATLPQNAEKESLLNLLVTASTLVETFQGKVWLDTETESGNTVNLLLPLLEEINTASEKGDKD